MSVPHICNTGIKGHVAITKSGTSCDDVNRKGSIRHVRFIGCHVVVLMYARRKVALLGLGTLH